MSTSAARFRYIGTTDDTTTCEKCGKTHLRTTLVIQPLDRDGNDDGDVLYYGSTCAARALAIRGGGTSARKSADGARIQTLMAAHDAVRMLNLYGYPLDGEIPEAEMPAAAIRWAKLNPHAARDARDYADLRAWVLDMLSRKHQAIREAVLVAGPDWIADRQPYDYGYASVIRACHAPQNPAA